mmetsp:Transcript_21936/g.37645  ORF Transcript_21936/g.37645 Transcript_21936/m.37645 type:complete len:299 (-) Transcript_21936:10-906(-)
MGEVTGAIFALGDETIEELLVGLCGLVEHSRIDGRREEIVGSGNSVDVASHVQIELFHRNYLGVAPTSCTAFDSKSRTLTWLPNACEYLLSQMCSESLAQPHGCGTFAFSKRRRSDTGDHDVVAIRLGFEAVQHSELNLGLIFPIRLKLIGKDANVFRNLLNGNWRNALRNIDVAGRWPHNGKLAAFHIGGRHFYAEWQIGGLGARLRASKESSLSHIVLKVSRHPATSMVNGEARARRRRDKLSGRNFRCLRRDFKMRGRERGCDRRTPRGYGCRRKESRIHFWVCCGERQRLEREI